MSPPPTFTTSRSNSPSFVHQRVTSNPASEPQWYVSRYPTPYHPTAGPTAGLALPAIIARRLEEFPTVTADQRAVLVEVVAEVKGIEAALLAEARGPSPTV